MGRDTERDVMAAWSPCVPSPRAAFVHDLHNTHVLCLAVSAWLSGTGICEVEKGMPLQSDRQLWP